MVRHNRTKAKIRAGEVVYGVTVGVSDPNIVELAGALGFDFAIIDCEHDLFNGRDLENNIRAANLHDMTPIVRMQNNPELMLHALNAGAQGILIARVNSAADARAVIDAAKFHPEGRRTVFFRSRGGSFALDVAETSPKQWSLDINRETMIGCIIEEIDGVRNLDEILSIPEIDFIDLGPLDLAHSMGWADQAEVNGHIARIVSDSVKAGKAVASPATAETISGILDKGFRMLTVSPIVFFQAGSERFLKEADTIIKSRGIAPKE
jgi:2-keto-3-deoxy-L-rhamnonate aldolase RhmA